MIRCMRILFVTSKLNFETAGGSVPDLDLKVKTLTVYGHEVSVLTVFSERNTYTTVPYPVIKEHLPHTMRLVLVQYKLFRFLKKYENDFDLFHIEGQFAYGGGLYRRLGGKRPVVVFFNREPIAWIPVEGTLRKIKHALRVAIEKTAGAFLANAVDRMVFTNPNLQKGFADFGLHAPHSLMPDFANPEEKYTALGVSEPVPEERGKPKESVLLLASGRMIPEKGFGVILDALSHIKNKEKFQLIISGDGPDKPRLEQMVADLNLEGSVSLPGWVKKEELLEYLAKADIFILPKWRTDLTSVLLLEAMIFGAPCVIPQDTGIAWVAGQGGLTFIEDDAKDLAQKIEQLVSNPDLRVSLSRGCLSRMKELDYKKMGRELESIMMRLTQHP